MEHPIVFNDFDFLNYEIKRKVPSSRDPIQSPGSPPVGHPTISNDFGSLNYEIKRKVPSGPDPIQSPRTPPVEHPIISNDFCTFLDPLNTNRLT